MILFFTVFLFLFFFIMESIASAASSAFGAIRKLSDKVMQISEEERLVLDATSLEKWGPTAQQMQAICRLTRQSSSRTQVNDALCRRLGEPGKHWRAVYKTLLVIDYTLKNGSPECATFWSHHVIDIRTLQRFQHTDSETHKDVGINVRERAKIVLTLITDKGLLEEERKKAQAPPSQGPRTQGQATAMCPIYSLSSGYHERRL